MTHSSVGPFADKWSSIADILETEDMPPADADKQPTDAERNEATKWVRGSLKSYELAHGGEPGHVTIRRLTSGEYAYAIRDLTGIDIATGVDASSDSVGGEGFTNFGDVQFVQDATIERFLEAAKGVADHAVVGAGPLDFYADAGKTGLELSALNRIDEIYSSKGFRVVSGEGGSPFGLERYTKAFYVSWYFKNRKALGDPKATLRGLAEKEGITGLFAEHVSAVMNRHDLGFPTRSMAERWHAIAKPDADIKASLARARAGCEELTKYLTIWPSWFFARGDAAVGGLGDESPLMFDDKALKAEPSHHYDYELGKPQKPKGPRVAGPWKVYLAVDSVNPDPAVKPVVIWRNPRILTHAVVPGDPSAPAAAKPKKRVPLGSITSTQSLRSVLSKDDAAALAFGKSLDHTPLGPDDFATNGLVSFQIEDPVGDDVVEFQVEAELGEDRNAVLRVMVSDRPLGNPLDSLQRTLLGDAASAGYRKFRAGMAEYVSILPPNSHGEANPADKDPVPPPFDNTYNSPEHDAFVLKVKYQRNDAFFTEHIVEGADRDRLNQAWADLFGSWPYHDGYLGVLADHYRFKLKSSHIEDLDAAQIAAWPAEARPHVTALRQNYDDIMQIQTKAESGHVEDALEFASRAWRRPLTPVEKNRLRNFYLQARKEHALDHDDAIRTLLARILVSPAFLYRVEAVAGPAERPLNDWEMASRLSFFLWSSIPDDELQRAASAGELSDPKKLALQVKRMTADPKSRRLATEFFGQWLGFYRFDQFRGVDTGRFPEFSEEIKSSMYDEAVSTFEYIVRQNRPVQEILYADYTFLNQPLAKFYGINAEVKSTSAVVKVDGANAFNRGGVLRLGSVLTATSAPLRTSPVKRGDWILRRILGTPTPPPPANAGTLPSDPKAFGGLTLRERLAVHKRNPACAACHLKIDPLGFPLETFDAVGRTRTAYQDGTAVDLTGEFSDKSTILGVEGLLGYLHAKDALIMKTLAKKMLGYALGRTVLASDQLLVDELIKAGSNATFADLATKIVSSRQFRNREGEQTGQISFNLEPDSGVAGVGVTPRSTQGLP